MISLSTITFDMAGNIIFRNELLNSNTTSVSRRLTRTKTLDGGVVLQDKGFSHGDRTFSFLIPNAIQTDVERLYYIISTYSEIYLVTSDGFFKGNLSTYSFLKGILRFTFLVSMKL